MTPAQRHHAREAACIPSRNCRWTHDEIPLDAGVNTSASPTLQGRLRHALTSRVEAIQQLKAAVPISETAQAILDKAASSAPVSVESSSQRSHPPSEARKSEGRSPSANRRKPVLALGYLDKRENVVVTDVLCLNFPALSIKELASLSWKLNQWSESLNRHPSCTKS